MVTPTRIPNHPQSRLSSSTLAAVFWFLTIGMIAFSYFFTEYLIEQHHERIQSSASISAKGLADIVDERISQHRLMVQTIAEHQRDRIHSLAKGGGYPYDLSEISNEVMHLLPETVQFAILDHNGDATVGSEGLFIGPKCQSEIHHTLSENSLSPFPVRVHQPPHSKFHYDVVHKLQRGDEVAGLFLSFSLEGYKQLIEDFNTGEFDFILVDSQTKFDTLVSSAGVGESQYGKTLETDLVNGALAIVPVTESEWSLIGVPKSGLFADYAKRVRLSALVLLVAVFALVLGLLIYLQKVELAHKRLEEDSLQDALFNVGPTVLFQKQPMGANEPMLIEYVSPNIEKLIGYSQQTVVGKGYEELLVLEDVQTVQSALEDAFEHQEAEVEVEYRLKDFRNGESIWVSDVSHIVYDQQKKPAILQSYVSSIHAQKMAEQHANDLIENAPDAMAVTDDQGVIVRVNRAFEGFFGCPRDEIIGQPIMHYIDYSSREVFKKFKQSFLHDDVAHHSSLVSESPLFAVTQSGIQRPVEISLSSMESLEEYQVVHIIRDVSAQIEAQRQMQNAKDNAESLAKARSRFVATMSHEIRTPLNGVLGMANLLMHTPLNPKQNGYLTAIEYSGQSLLKIINGILDFAKLDEGALSLESEPFNLNMLVLECLQIVQAQAEEGEVSLFFNNRLNTKTQYLGDAGRLQQVLLNLLGNAIKFTPEGRVDIEISQVAGNHDNPTQPHIKIEVKDSGIGIAEENLSKLFDSFSQADESTTRQYGGTGLGLTIAKQLTELMGGEIGVSSQLNLGSRFWIQIPLEEIGAPLKMDSIAIQAVAPLPFEKVLNDKLILLVEDNEINQQVIIGYLKRLGAKVDLAENGIEGLSFWRMNSKKYDLILMDCQMPVMDGYEATRMIRKEESLGEQGREIPIVALTANAMHEDRERCLLEGMNDFIAKPIEVDLFNKVMVKWASAKSMP